MGTGAKTRAKRKSVYSLLKTKENTETAVKVIDKTSKSSVKDLVLTVGFGHFPVCFDLSSCPCIPGLWFAQLAVKTEGADT